VAEARPLSSTRSPLIARIRALGARPGADPAGPVVLDGVRLIEAALAADVHVEVCVYDPAEARAAPRLGALIGALRSRGVRLVPAVARVVAAAGQVETSQGVVAVAVPRAASPAEAVGPAHLLLMVADGVQDPGNLGTIVRVADAAGATAVAVTGPAAGVRHPKTVRATMGSLFHLPVVEMDRAALITMLQTRGARILVADHRGATVYSDGDYTPPVALVVGSEAHGPDPQWRAAATDTLRIPLYGRAESLNVAMAAALLLYEARRAPRTAEVRR
jgi:TrmH family RNA methyltransferase